MGSRLCRQDGSWLEGVEERPLAGDASIRRYSRLTAPDGSTAIVVRYPPGSRSAFRRDMEVLDWCEKRGLRVPRRYGTAVGKGICCFEDWGNEDAEAVLRGLDPKRREELALDLVAPLVILAAVPPGELPAWNPPLDEGRLRRELGGCEEWFFGRLLDHSPDVSVAHWFDELARRVAGHPLRVCHRDYHLNNLFFLPDGTVGALDIQDILVGPDTYDAVSLVGDRAFPELFGPEFRQRWLEHWARGTSPGPGWEERVEEAEAQRGFKVLGTFARLSLQRSPTYARWLPPLVRRMAALGDKLGAPRRLVAFLVDWVVNGEHRLSG